MGNENHISLLSQGIEAWNKWRKENNNISPDLSGADFSRVNLQGANFTRTNLSSTKLSTNLQGANLSRSDLTRADFLGEHLEGADLTRAKLIGADLTLADLSGALLVDADLSGAILCETLFRSSCFSQTKGLDSCKHEGPSTIDFRTLERSDHLPLGFLRGVGLPEALIEKLPIFLRKPIQFFSCFISYSHEDWQFARKLHDRLQGMGIRCWLDDHQVLPGDDIPDAIDHGIRQSDKTLICCSEFSLKKSVWVDREIEKALQKEEKLFKERGSKILVLIPLNLDDYLFRWESGKASIVKSRLAADFREWHKDETKFELQFQRLIKSLRSDKKVR